MGNFKYLILSEETYETCFILCFEQIVFSLSDLLLKIFNKETDERFFINVFLSEQRVFFFKLQFLLVITNPTCL